MDPASLSGFHILERLSGHIPARGKSAGEELNWAYKLQDISTNEICIGMFCKPHHITFIDNTTWDALQTDQYKYLTWYYSANGYISRTVKGSNVDIPYLTLHQFIMRHCGKGKGGKSIDHINQNKLDNRSINLRITDQSIQNINRGKVSRHYNAKVLPVEIQYPLPKYCVYYKEAYNKEKTRWREFFTIEGHPAQDGKRKATSKSEKVGIIDKLKEAQTILDNLDAMLMLPQS